jgi:hypothetical protein
MRVIEKVGYPRLPPAAHLLSTLGVSTLGIQSLAFSPWHPLELSWQLEIAFLRS